MDIRGITLCLIPVLLVFMHSQESAGQGRRQPQCEQGSCYPATGDLLIGREQNLSATSTCGLDRPERYCIVSYVEQSPKCFTCDSREPFDEVYNNNSHRIENVVSSFKRGARKRWWQAENGVEQVSIQLDLEAEFHFTHMIMTFKTFRPKAMVIERSFDFGNVWKTYRYFAEDCSRSFPKITKRVVNNISDIICDQSYSDPTPSTQGEVIFRILPPSIFIRDPYDEEVQDLLKITNLRINFTELHTLGDTLLDTRPEIKEKYYYSLYDITVRGSCSCYGHASRCLPVNGNSRDEQSSRNMVHGRCECTHNTRGLNCELCEDFYHDHPWRPAQPAEPNVCKRCNCNNHATKCHFDLARWFSSGNVTGGICDNCQHNTKGVNCHQCKTYFYKDPMRDIRDPEVCQPCDCDPLGSLAEGVCDDETDERAGKTAGRCKCKEFVEGARCDRCLDNYYNLQLSNPQGCEPCSCNPIGTLPDSSCDQDTGLCNCKRFVTNENCDACYPGFYGLSEDDPYGCRRCECDLGGSYSNACDQQSGQCECRPNIGSRQCKKVDPGYFYAHLDYYLYEAENGVGSGNARVYIREPIPGNVSYWTGTGYMRVMEGDTITFTVDDLPFDTYYDIIVRYDSRTPDVFEDVKVTLIRPDVVDPEGLCGDFDPSDDFKSTSLEPSQRFHIVSPPSCLERDTEYKVRIEFRAYRAGRSGTQDASLYIDSILLVPNPEYIPIFVGTRESQYLKNDFITMRCGEQQFPSIQSELSDMCKMITFSISAVQHNGALACECDRTGSTSVECNPDGGQCPCKPNVVGRKCDQCAAGTFGFGPNGCSPCNCDIASRDSFCDPETGQCTCIENVAGRTCDQCRYGYWGYPQCRQCQCNGNAETCAQDTGECESCTNNTAGNYCERCEDGYYGDPRIGRRIPCKPCMCPQSPDSGVFHADSCRYNPRTQDVYCSCKPGYTGRNCDTCIENYFGSPNTLGGTCEACVCNNNIEPNDPGSCDARTGECLKCLYNTEGFACEHCRSGYYGDATQQTCRRCVCNQLGTDFSQGECDRETGQCPCLPNVVGQSCDQCDTYHWNLTSGEGCAFCNCDPSGSESLQCNLLDGRCRCIPGRGGDKCADCEDLFYGDPNIQCLPCDCDMQGSSGRQCERRSGQCDCVEGVTGYKCDRCARGTTGELPNCEPCGECFDNWDKIIMDLRDQTNNVRVLADDVSYTGAIKAFDEEFRQMQENIDEIKKILSGVNLTQVDIKDITDKMEMISSSLQNYTHQLMDVEAELRNSSTRVKKGDLRVDMLKSKVAELQELANQLKNNATEIQLQEASGAYDKVLEAQRESQAAQAKVDGTEKYLRQSEQIRNQTDALVKAREQLFKEQVEENSQALDALETDVEKLDMNLAEINGLVCGGIDSDCSDLCGGGGCGQCGGPGCNGSVTKAQKALELALKTEEMLNEKTMTATQELEPQMEDALRDAEDARDNALMAHEEASKVRNQTDETRTGLKELMDRIRAFLIGNDTASPDDVKKVVEEVLAMEIPLGADEIRNMSDKISNALASLTDIEKILDETEEKRKIAEQLKIQANNASEEAQQIREEAQDVRNALNETKLFQEKAEMAIQQAEIDIMEAEDDLKQISNASEAVKELSKGTSELLQSLQDRLESLTRRYKALELNTLDQATSTAAEAEEWADKAYKKAMDLNETYAATSKELDSKFNETEMARDLSQQLKDRAEELYKLTETQLSQLKDIEGKLGEDEDRLSKLSDEIAKLNMEMDGYLTTIRDKAKFYETC